MLISGMKALSAQDLTGYSVGLNVSYPLVTGTYFEDHTGPSVGVVVDTPYGFDLGPLAVGVGVGIEMLNVGSEDLDENTYNHTGFYLSLSSAVYETPSGAILVSGTGGWYTGGLVFGGAVMFDYAVPDQPIVFQPYARSSIFNDAAGDGSTMSHIMSIGAQIIYSF